MLPPGVRVARDTQDLLIDCCVEFINLVSSESNEVCSKEDRKTIAPEYVLKAQVCSIFSLRPLSSVFSDQKINSDQNLKDRFTSTIPQISVHHNF
ncbi:putative transcription factor Hap3/NF-YB family [Helianthus annuus]|nr:putative transcription factor Hap3/NF-YB family [Helianthus annuus]